MGNEYQLFKLKGTTFSGHPTLTTLGNTLRSIMYAKYALYELQLPHNILAAGDDLVVWVQKPVADLFVNKMKSLAYTTKDVELNYGLGQVIKEYAV